MQYSDIHKKNEQNDRRKSAVITFFVSFLVFLVIYFYQFSKTYPIEQKLTTMLINFGNNENGNTTTEPKQQDGSQSSTNTNLEPKIQEINPNQVNPIISGTNKKISTSTQEKILKEKVTKTSKTNINESTPNTKPNINKGDGKGNTAIDNLIRGRGKNTSQGNNEKSSNQGDPLGGNGNGDSKIGIDRKLIGFIPGTMGRGGQQPNHNCKATGTITISYNVNKSGIVTYAKRISGLADPCVVNTSIEWVKKYVIAEPASTSSTGTYKITF